MAADRQQDEAEDAPRSLWQFLPLALVVAVIAAFFATGLHRTLSLESLVRHDDGIRQLIAAHYLAAIVIYALAYIVIVSVSIPASALLTTLGGYLFGWALGGTVAAMAATLGATNIFLIARTSLGDLLRRRAGIRLQALAKGFRKEAFSYVLFLRLLPVMPFWITNLAAAVFGVRLKTFVIATQLGLIPTSFAFAVAGSGLGDVMDRQEQIYRECLDAAKTDCKLTLNPENLLTTELVVALAVLGMLALSPILLRRWRERRQEERA